MFTRLAVLRQALAATVLHTLALAFVARSQAAPLDFQDYVLYPAGQMPADVAAVDLNGDLASDIVVANVLSADISVLLNRQDGTFAPEVRYPAGGQARSIAAGDLNGDTYLDLAVGLQSGPHALAVFLNDGQGAFSAADHFGTGGAIPNTTVITHLDADEHVDIAMSRIFSDRGQVAVFINDGDGTIHHTDIYELDPDAFISGLAVADLEGDSDIDLIATFAYSSEAPFRLINRGRGTFDVAEPFNTEITFVTPGIGAGDFDGDGSQDITAISGGGILLYRNGGGGSFGDPVVHDPDVPTSSVSRMTPWDLDRDGALDLVVPGGAWSVVGTLRNDGSGALVEESLHPTGSFAADAAVSDLNGDDWPDIVVANRDGNSVSVLLSAAASASVAAEAIGLRAVWLGPLRPNPARPSLSGVSAPYRVAVGLQSWIAVYDAAGRTISLEDGGTTGAGWTWDLRDARGRTVQPGTYFVALEAGGLRETRKLTVVR
jgi:FG-GAP-like repeat